METSQSQLLNEKSGEVDRVYGELDRLNSPNKSPLYLLFLIFLFYAFVDLLSTWIEFGEIDGWLMAQYHFVMGYLVCALYMKLVLPEFFTRKRKVLAVFYFLFLFLALVVVKLWVHNLFLGPLILSKGILIGEFNRLFNFLILTTVVWFFYNNLKLGRSKFAVELQHEQLKVMHRSMQLSSHFVLNSLSVYLSKILRLSPSLATEFFNLTALFKYSFKEFGQPNFLDEEVQAVEKYLQVQRFRFPDLSLDTVIDLPSGKGRFPMPKLCLLTLVENVFFHGDYTDKAHPCSIKFLLEQDEDSGTWKFTGSILNKVQKYREKPRTGFGSSTVFRVLGHEFGDGFYYKVHSDDLSYSLLITINYGKEIQNRAD